MDLDLWDCFGRKNLRLITKDIWYLAKGGLNLFSYTYSAGKHQVLGKTLYSFGNILSIRFIFLASKSFRQISLIPGKWLIFWRKHMGVIAVQYHKTCYFSTVTRFHFTLPYYICFWKHHFIFHKSDILYL